MTVYPNPKPVERLVHVLYIHQYFSTRQGAHGTRSYEFARALIASGHSVTMLCGTTAGSDTGLDRSFAEINSSRSFRRGLVDGIDVIEICIPYSNYQSLTQRALTFLRFCFQAVHCAMRERYDIVCATSTPLTVAIPGIAARWLRGKPFVFEVRDLWPELPIAMGLIRNPVIKFSLRLLEWSAYKSAHACIALAPGIQAGIAKRGIRKERVHLIPNGCDGDLFVPREGRIEIPGIKKDDFVAIFCGAHGVANGLDAVLDAALLLQQAGADTIKFLFVGDGKMKPVLKKRAGEQSLHNCIFMDPLPKEALADLLPRADIGLMILANVPEFYYGTSPNKFFDYIACGLPVLVNYPGWIAEIVEQHHCGVAVPPADSRAFAEGLLKLQSSKQELNSMRLRARALSEQQFPRSMLARQFIAALQEHVPSADAARNSVKAEFHG